jgi:hypothetical protein
MVDNLAMPTDNDFSIKINVPLMGDKIACPICEKREVHLFFISLNDLDKHIVDHHIDTPIKWTCIECNKSFLSCMGQDATYPSVKALR